ncbi:hypothetical protein [Frigoriglobus tundricola]|uniref:Uncharacterized protein n=1 Tax=Frigoriglobus tundricola TaxID=2774151 RepID=A0A6M5YYP3_9BACT|nr:hypothetical protein [Frigoriglobus tundricola]QJW98654.1 hypothetical protein FTUN_6249 [Frigoriglobus tundricola]
MRTIGIPPLKRAAVVIPRGVSTIPIMDHRIAVREYLNVLGLNIQEQAHVFLVLEASTPVLRIAFDKQGRMIKFKALVGDVTTPIPAEVTPLLPALD